MQKIKVINEQPCLLLLFCGCPFLTNISQLFSSSQACWSFKSIITRKHVSFQIMICVCSLSILKTFLCISTITLFHRKFKLHFSLSKQSHCLSPSDSCLGLAIDLSAVVPNMHALNECNPYSVIHLYPTMPFKRPETQKVFNKTHLDWFPSLQIRMEGQGQFPVTVGYSIHNPAADLEALSLDIVQSGTN